MYQDLWIQSGGHRGLDRMVSMLVAINTKAESSNPAHGKVYFIQHYVIKFVKWLAVGLWFSPGTPPPIKLSATIYLKYRWKWRSTIITVTPIYTKSIFTLFRVESYCSQVYSVSMATKIWITENVEKFNLLSMTRFCNNLYQVHSLSKDNQII